MVTRPSLRELLTLIEQYWDQTIYFRQDWCPTPAEIATLERWFRITRGGGCCLFKAERLSNERIADQALDPFRDKIAQGQDLGYCSGSLPPPPPPPQKRVVYFRQDWCPLSSDVEVMKRRHEVTMQGCCVYKAEALEFGDAGSADLLPFEQWVSKEPDISHCTGENEETRAAALKAEQDRLAAERQQAEAERRELPQRLRAMSEDDLCVQYGRAIRDESIHEARWMGPKAAMPALRAEIRRRGLRVNDSLAKTSEIQIGATECTLYASWSLPIDINRTVTAGSVHKQFVFNSFGPYVYTRNGLITGWQD